LLLYHNNGQPGEAHLDTAWRLPTFHLREASRRDPVGCSMRLRRRLRLFLMATLRGSVVALSLLGYLAASIGFPAPAPSADRTSSRDDRSSPCSGGTCGCGSAPNSEHCCCCSAKTKPSPPPPPTKRTPDPKPCCVKGRASDTP